MRRILEKQGIPPRTPAEDTKALVESIRSRFRAEAPRVPGNSSGGASLVSAPAGERLEDLDRELRDYFAQQYPVHAESSGGPDMALLRERVIDAVADRILEQWDAPRDSALQEEIMERIISRILERLKLRTFDE